MTPAQQRLLDGFDGHDVEEVRAALRDGADARSPVRGKLPIEWLTEQHTRSDRLPACLRLLLEAGAVPPDPVIVPVLLDDADAVRAAVRSDPLLLNHRTTMVSSFTPLVGASLLHVAAEYGNLNAARALVELGADVNATAAVDEHGLNGHTPLFHTVNSNANRAEPIMRLLLAAGANAGVRLAGITWGKGFEWETTFFDVTPVSYAQLGLMPQVHRRDRDIYANIRLLLEAAGRPVPPLANVPNRYLQPKGGSKETS
ncbi:MAG TPA: ankyrin repeat domain-containing protein [Gemmataceae bacterium]|nr:ankyrin repeat domain-containing protein [Gemmataceae bacterium]